LHFRWPRGPYFGLLKYTVGRVSDVTWSKIQHSSATILENQAYALRQLADLTNKIEDKAKVDDLAKIAKTAEVEVSRWLAEIARCFKLHDAIAVLELDRVFDTAPNELDEHRLGLSVARQDRLELISDSTQLLLERMSVAADRANAKVLLNPIQSPAVVRSTNNAASEVHELRQLLEIDSRDTSSESRRWGAAAGEQWGKVRDASAGGIDSAKRLNTGTLDQARSAKDKVAGKARGTGAASVGSAKSLGNSSRGKARSMKDRLTKKQTKGEPPQGDDDLPDVDN
jgi:type IV secretory pathway VirJ component